MGESVGEKTFGVGSKQMCVGRGSADAPMLCLQVVLVGSKASLLVTPLDTEDRGHL